jgi:Chlorophyll A-B binding protein
MSSHISSPSLRYPYRYFCYLCHSHCCHVRNHGQDALGLGLHFPGFPEADWTTALGVFSREQPVWFGAILALICIAEGESVGHSGDNFRGKSTKEVPGNLNFDYLGLKKKLSPQRFERYQMVEKINGRAAMIAMASLFAFKAVPGSVPIMDILGAS